MSREAVAIRASFCVFFAPVVAVVPAVRVDSHLTCVYAFRVGDVDGRKEPREYMCICLYESLTRCCGRLQRSVTERL